MFAHRHHIRQRAVNLQALLQLRIEEIHQPHQCHRNWRIFRHLLRPADLPHGIFGEVFMPDNPFHAARRAILPISFLPINPGKHRIISHQRLVNRVLLIQKYVCIGVAIIPMGMGINDLQSITRICRRSGHGRDAARAEERRQEDRGRRGFQTVYASGLWRGEPIYCRMTKAQRDAIHLLWDSLADFPVSETDQALSHLMEGIARMIGAGNAYWLGYIRLDAGPGDPLKGLRPCANRYLYPAPIHDESYKAQMGKWKSNQINEGYVRAARDVGQFRSFRLRKEMRPGYFEEEFYQIFHASRGFHDQCIVFFPVNEDYESMFNFQRVGVKKDFTADEEALAAHALRGLKWFHRKVALSHGLLIAESPLSPAQRQVAQLLLTERSEKQISEEIGKTARMTHKYITEIFRKFGVNSRAGLMAVWLGKTP